MMVGDAEYYLENEEAIGFSKNYKDGRYSFIGILPKEEGDFTLESLNIESLLDSKEQIETNIQLPKFEFEYSNSLREYLIDSGLKSSFYNSNFSNIFEKDNNLVVDDVIQKCKITVDEEGTVASAITIVVTKNSMSINDTKKVHIDRPFAFMIYDNEQDIILLIIIKQIKTLLFFISSTTPFLNIDSNTPP